MLRLSRISVYIPSICVGYTQNISPKFVQLLDTHTKHTNGFINQGLIVTRFDRKYFSTDHTTQTGKSRDGEETSIRDILYKKIVLTLKGHEPEVLRSYETFIKKVSEKLGLDASSETRNRPVFTRLSLNRSPFIYKKHQRQYEMRTYYKYITVEKITGCTADVFLEYIQRNIPEGIAMEVSRHRVEQLPEHLALTTDTVDA